MSLVNLAIVCPSLQVLHLKMNLDVTLGLEPQLWHASSTVFRHTVEFLALVLRSAPSTLATVVLTIRIVHLCVTPDDSQPDVISDDWAPLSNALDLNVFPLLRCVKVQLDDTMEVPVVPIKKERSQDVHYPSVYGMVAAQFAEFRRRGVLQIE